MSAESYHSPLPTAGELSFIESLVGAKSMLGALYMLSLL